VRLVSSTSPPAGEEMVVVVVRDSWTMAVRKEPWAWMAW